ncbi:hypothetical protein EST38_g11296 [Candolleomyces aberdarensis]|uniref:Uncharacterized protein n=1 Tax=Candolleomyces aberdarensis TaxID=2316362 RepID=A0A4Q2D7J4_9AGAR|nr:hypothetical protein EST38_g11296 [Candolleomyces aberdarensis]
MLDHESEDQMLIIRLGILCASKGYEDFVSTHISPVLSVRLTASDLADWKLQVDHAATAFKTFYGEMALEEESWDYHLVGLPAAPAPTILHMVEKTLPSILPEPSSKDNLIFEDQDSEYASVQISADDTSNPQFRATRMIKKMFVEKEQNEAYQFLLELRELGITPAPSRAFFFAAHRTLEALLSPDVDPQVASVLRQQYTAWLQLIPDNVNVRSLTRLLFHAPTPDLLAVSETATILTAKGHARRVVVPASRILYRDPASTFGVQFLKDLEATSWRYCDENPTPGVRELHSDLHLRARSTVIKAFARVGRFDEAIELLPGPDSGLKLPISVYDILLHGIRQSQTAATSEYLEVVQAHRLKALAITQDMPVTLPSDTPSLPDEILESDLASSLRLLKRSFKRGSPGPHPQALLSFMEAYLATGRTYALALLFNKAASTSHFHTATFLYAEMMFYFRHYEYDAILETVVDHFYLGNGIPRPLVLAWERDRQKRHAEANPNWAPVSSRFITAKRSEQRTKIWPTSAHTSLLWQAVTLRTKDYPKVQLLYKALLQSLREGLSVDESKPKSLRANPNLALPESSAFVPFLRKMMNKEGFEKGPEIMSDMISLGRTPTVAHFTEIAHQYARAGETDRAMMILGRLEDSLRRAKETGQTEATRGPASVFPDVAMYVSLMRAFIAAKNTEAAEEVARRLDENLGWDEEYPPLQNAVKDLEELKLSKAEEKERAPRYAA